MPRPLTFLLALLALVLFAPVMLLVAALIRFNLGRPVLFRQARAGLHGKPFVLLKFRTMADSVDAEGRPLPDAGGVISDAAAGAYPSIGVPVDSARAWKAASSRFVIGPGSPLPMRRPSTSRWPTTEGLGLAHA